MIEIKDLIQCSALEAQALADRWQELKLGGVINVAHNTTEMKYPEWLPVLRHPHLDDIQPSREWFGPVLAFYDWARTRGRVVIHCAAGKNRSTGTAGVILIARHGFTAQQAMECVGRPGFAAFIRAVEEYR